MADYLKWDSGKIKSRLLELLDLAQFSDRRLDDFPLQISGGQRQRVSLMRALMLDPDVLLLDEPLGALDPMVRSKLQSDLKQIFQSLGKTVIMVTHDMGEAAFFGDIIILMREGRVIQQGTMLDFIESPGEPFVTDFINAQRSPLDTIGGGSN
jgi:osmoprotectant transport system ATP-binding protein